MHMVKRIAAVAGLLALGAAGSLTAAHGVSAANDVVGHVYVDDNTAGTNTIAAFNRHADGTLTPLHGSPFAAGGAGTGVGIGSQGSLQLSGDGQYLLAADAGSNQISVLHINSDGELTPVGGGSVWSGGIKPVSIAVHGNLVYVANAGAGGSNYTGFTLNPGGHLRPLAGSTVPLLDTANPGDVLFNSTGTHLIGAEVNTSVIDSFVVGADGRLSAAPGSPFTAQGLGPFGSEFRPTDPTQLFVSNAHNVGPTSGTISALSVASNGVLSSIGSSPYGDLQQAPCWVEISPDGQYLFAVNTASVSISSFQINNDGSLGSLQSTSPFGPAGTGPTDARLDPSGAYLYVVEGGAHGVGGFAVSGGSLTQLTSSPVSLPAGAHPFGIVVD
jgi:6-phosphogluconolactonase (cycloisomerase 2 family)